MAEVDTQTPEETPEEAPLTPEEIAKVELQKVLAVRRERCGEHLAKLVKTVDPKYVEHVHINSCWLQVSPRKYFNIQVPGVDNLEEDAPPVFRMMTYKGWDETPDEYLEYSEPRYCKGLDEAIKEVARVIDMYA